MRRLYFINGALRDLSLSPAWPYRASSVAIQDLSSPAQVALGRRTRGICGSSPRNAFAACVPVALLMLLLATTLPAAELANLNNGFSIRAEHHESVGVTTRLYMSAEPAAGYVDVPTASIESFETAPPEPQETAPLIPRAQDLKTIVSAASSQHQIDADFIASVIQAESANNPHAISPKGAQGLMQLMPGTAGKLGVKNSFDPAQNVDGGVRYLRELLLLYDGDMAKALAAYNAGPGRVKQYHGVPPYRETHAYVARVINDYNRKKRVERKQQPQVHRVLAAKPALAQTASASTAGEE